MPLSLKHRFLQTVGTISFLCISSITYSESINVYSARQEGLIKPLLDQFTDSSGIQVKLVTGKGDALLTRLKLEGANSPADILITIDAGRLYRAQEAGIFQPVSSEKLSNNVPKHLRSKDNLWYGLSMRARTIIYSKERVSPEELSTYEELANPKWAQRLCIRSSGNIYNQSLVASLLANNGTVATEMWLKGITSNFARKPQGGDRDQVMAVAAGVCDIAVINTYYLGGMLKSSNESQQEAAMTVDVFWPNQLGRGAHVNISGAGITKASQSPENAKKLLEFLTSPNSQRWYAKVNNEYPVDPRVGASQILKNWGDFKSDSLPVDTLGKLNMEAVKSMDKAGWP